MLMAQQERETQVSGRNFIYVLSEKLTKNYKFIRHFTYIMTFSLKFQASLCHQNHRQSQW